MRPVAIIVNSKYGATEKYAKLLAEKTGGDLFDFKEFRPKKLKDYEFIIYCAGIYEGGIANLFTLERSMGALEGKKVAVFCVGASPYVEEEFRALYRKYFDGKLKDVPAFYGRGAWNAEKLSFKDRSLAKLTAGYLRRKEELSPWEEEYLSFYQGVRDWTDPRYLEPLLGWIKKESSPERAKRDRMIRLENF